VRALERARADLEVRLTISAASQRRANVFYRTFTSRGQPLTVATVSLARKEIP
jgi:hypothetical protein